MARVDPTLWPTYQTERAARRNVARNQLRLHQVLDMEDFYDFALGAHNNARCERLRLALVVREAGRRGESLADIARRPGLTEADVKLLSDGPLIAGEAAAKAIDAELRERFKERPENERERTVDEARRARTLAQDTARRDFYKPVSGG